MFEQVPTPVPGSPGGQITIEQGPQWLVRLLFYPPPWVGTIMTLIVVVVVAGVGYQEYRYGIKPAQLEAAATNGLVVLGVIVATPLIRETFALPYLLDVLCGAAVGIGGVRLGLAVARRAWVFAVGSPTS